MVGPVRLTPNDTLISELTAISNGSLTEYFSSKDIDSFHDDRHEGEFWSKMNAQNRYAQMTDHRYYAMGFIDVERPYRDEGMWVVNVFGTERLNECLAGLNQGLVWNCEEQRVDYQLTEAMLLDGISRGYLTQWYIDMALKNKAPELAAARAKLVQWKLSAHLEGDRWVQ